MNGLQLLRCLLRALVVTCTRFAAENLSLLQQLAVYKQQVQRPRLRQRDRIFWVWMSRLWSDWRSTLVIVQLEKSEDSSGVTTYTFNGAGSQTVTETPDGALTTNTWDDENRLLTLEKPDGYIHTSTYNADSLRVQKVEPAPMSGVYYTYNGQWDGQTGDFRPQSLHHAQHTLSATLRGVSPRAVGFLPT